MSILIPRGNKRASNEIWFLKTYVILLKKWQKRINLVSTATLADVWCRHVLDSAQLYGLIPASAKKVIDIGSGAGFPGLVLALYFKHYGGPEIHLVESDSRKCSFFTKKFAHTHSHDYYSDRLHLFFWRYTTYW